LGIISKINLKGLKQMANCDNKNFAYDEMMVHVPLCSHKEIKKILVVGEVTEEFKKELNKHQCKDVTFSDSLNVEGIFDIILYNKNENFDEMFMASVDRCLEQKKGIFVTKASFIYEDLEEEYP
jgi:spermidine synthase